MHADAGTNVQAAAQDTKRSRRTSQYTLTPMETQRDGPETKTEKAYTEKETSKKH